MGARVRNCCCKSHNDLALTLLMLIMLFQTKTQIKLLLCSNWMGTFLLCHLKFTLVTGNSRNRRIILSHKNYEITKTISHFWKCSKCKSESFVNSTVTTDALKSQTPFHLICFQIKYVPFQQVQLYISKNVVISLAFADIGPRMFRLNNWYPRFKGR